jgi:outer membrane receptor protein involved in Fe transport
VSVSGYKRDQSNLADFGGNAPPEHGRLLETEQDRYQLQWRHSAGNFLNFLNISYDKGTQGTPNVTEGPEYILKAAENTGSQDIVLMGANSFQQADTAKSWTIRNDSTFRMGDHTLKAGAQIVSYKLSRIEANSTNGTFFVVNPCAPPAVTCPASFDITTADPFAARININPAPGLKAKDTQIGLYITDEWKPDDQWTVNAGVRWDFESNPNNKDYVTPLDPKPTRQEVWRQLLNLRKGGKLPKLGEARSKPPDVSPEDKARLREMLGADIGKRDRLPYTPRFDQLVDAFNKTQGRPISPHLVWRLVATLAK